MKNLKFSLVALAVGLIAVIGLGVHFFAGSSNSAAVSTETNVGGIGGGSVFTNIDQYVNGLAVGDAIAYSKVLTLGARINQASWKNTTGKTAYVDFAEIDTDGTASSSYKFYVGTSTTATLSSDFVAPFSSLINGTAVATSTAATSTTSFDAVAPTPKTVQVPSGTYVFVQMQAANGAVCASSGSGICESATSTNRGFNVKALIKMHFLR